MAASKVFIRDDAYAWLPAELTAPIAPGDATASVVVTLPDDWDRFTVDPDHKSLGRRERTVRLSDYAGGTLPLQNLHDDGVTALGKSDMADLPHLHEAAVLYNLKDRHGRGTPYTRVGDIVVAVNPYRWIDGLYSERRRGLYSERLVWNAREDDLSNRRDILTGYFDRLSLEPHVYETSSNAYRGLAVDGRDQAILVSGESGAGKTETVKIAMTHLATLEGTRGGAGGGGTAGAGGEEGVGGRTDIVGMVLKSDPLFEAFGNASTARNHNSSRFGKFTRLHFARGGAADGDGGGGGGGGVPRLSLAGSTFVTYLLEKSRVASHGGGERTYHVLYQLLSAPEEERAAIWDGLRGADCSSFRYVGEPPAGEVDGRTDREAWVDTRDALADFGFGPGEGDGDGDGRGLVPLMRAVCVVLELGNVTFGLDPSDDEGSLITSPGELDGLSGLLGAPARSIRDALLTRRVAAHGEEIAVRLGPSKARDGCDALAKEVYAQVFRTLVEAINESTRPRPRPDDDDDGKTGCISILDMFGFESFDVNRFEQLCINYANERIQHKYVTDTFLAVREEYEGEGIEIFDFSAVDNTDVLTLIEGRTGLIVILNEECVRPKGNDESFVYKAKTVHRDSARLVRERLHRPTEFGVRHFAGTVKYDSAGFVERNMDRLPAALLDLAASSSNAVIRDSFRRIKAEKEAAEQRRDYRRKRGAATICSKFKSQLAALMGDIKDARTRYIRCIKPNGERRHLAMDHSMTMRQLASAGIVTAITVSRETFPNHLPYSAVWERFRVLLPGGGDGDPSSLSGSAEDRARDLLADLLRGREKVVGGHIIAPYACGRTKVFFRSGSLELLESDRTALYSARAAVIQRHVRGYLAGRRYGGMRKAAVEIQRAWRGHSARTTYLRKREATIRLQCWARRALAVRLLYRLRRHRAATVIQSRWKGSGHKAQLKKFKEAAHVIKRMVVSRRNKRNFATGMAAVVEEAQMDRKRTDLRVRLERPSPQDRDGLLRESADMIDYLSGQLHMQRGRVSDLKADLYKSRDAEARSAAHASTAEAALAASKLQAGRLAGENARLRQSAGEIKAGTTNLRGLLRSMQDAHNNARRKHQEELVVVKGSYTREIDALRRELESARRNHAAELLSLRHQISASEERHRAEMLRAQEELRKSEESHADDMSKMLDALGTAHEPDDGGGDDGEVAGARAGAGAGADRRGPGPGQGQSVEDELQMSLRSMTLFNAVNDLRSALCDACGRSAAATIGEIEGSLFG